MSDEIVQNLGAGAETDLKAKLGEAYAPLMSDTRSMLSGVSQADLAALESELGSRGLLESAIELRRAAFSSIETPSALDPALAADALRAGAEIRKLKGDAEFVKKFTSGDRDARDKFERLHERAYPERRK